MRKVFRVLLVSAFALGCAGLASVIDRGEVRTQMERIERHTDALYEVTRATLEGIQRWPASGSAYELWIMVETLERRGDRLESRYRDTRDFEGAALLVEAFGRELASVEELAPLVLPEGRALDRLAALREDHAALARLLEDERSRLREARPGPGNERLNVRDRRRAAQALTSLAAPVDQLLTMLPDPPASPEIPDAVGDGTMETLIDPAEAPDPLREDTSDLFVEPSEAEYVRRGRNAVFDELRVWLVLALHFEKADVAGMEEDLLRRRAARLLRVGRYVDRGFRRFEGELPRALITSWKQAREPQARLARVLGLPEPRL